MIFHDIQQNSPDWFEIRKGLITASKYHSLTMDNKTVGYQKAISEIALERCGVELNGWAGNESTERGHELEIIIRQYYESENLCDVQNGGFFTEGEWLGASPDGLIGTDGLIEIKSKTEANTWLEILKKVEEKKPFIPENHINQVNFQMYVTGREWCDYVVGSEGFKPIVTRLHRSQAVDMEIAITIENAKKDIIQLMEIINKHKL